MQVVFSPGAEIKFEGANNFRELGGYRAADGRQVKYGLLYRGGNLDLLKSEADHARLASLGLREILDLRSAGESAAHPDPAIPGGALPARLRYAQRRWHRDGLFRSGHRAPAAGKGSL